MNNNLLREGMQISSFIKNTDRIWEGILITRSDGLQTVFNEQTGRWRRLSDLDNIKILHEEEVLPSYDDVKNDLFGDIIGTPETKKPAEISKNTQSFLSNDQAKTKASEVLSDKISILSKEDQQQAPDPSDIEKVKKDIEEGATQYGAENGPNNDDPEEAMKDIEEIKKIAGLEESFSKLHPALQQILKEDRNYDLPEDFQDLVFNSEREVVSNYNVTYAGEELKQDGTGRFFTEKECLEAYYRSLQEKSDIKYEDEDYLDLPEDVKAHVIADIIEMLKKGEDAIENTIKHSYELSDSDAEEFIVKAMEIYLDTTDTKPKDSIDSITTDEVEKSFEKTIDDYNGPEDELLDHLANTYEIAPGEAEKIFEENQGKLTETIVGFINFVKNNKLR